MPMPTLRSSHLLLFVGVAVLFFSLAMWMNQAAREAEPLPWLVDWKAKVIEPLSDERLTLGELAGLAPGELWLQPISEGPRLAYRAEIDQGDDAWRLEAQLKLSESELESLAKAFGEEVSTEQPLSAQLLEQMGAHQIASLNLVPMGEVQVDRLIASVGPPRLRLRTAEGEAWVYPQQGISVHVVDGKAQLLLLMPREALKR
ncbi:hypothetical protein [Metapseudomonas boanensis]|uniref:DUF4340 domain-containing protein n=1 Tax=Metapseudomonas boanensis TaxID=2822138 RepID=A0ABS5XJJ4_9GAMM|nr:hypothetical protein [Pseudomonas boanensis]MBT8767864.1 hypothetical protein [Pseudomonas boanensis]